MEDTDTLRMHPIQRRIFQQMNPEQKLELALSLNYSAREWKAAALRNWHPELTEAEIQASVREAFLYART